VEGRGNNELEESLENKEFKMRLFLVSNKEMEERFVITIVFFFERTKFQIGERSRKDFSKH